MLISRLFLTKLLKQYFCKPAILGSFFNDIVIPQADKFDNHVIVLKKKPPTNRWLIWFTARSLRFGSLLWQSIWHRRIKGPICRTTTRVSPHWQHPRPHNTSVPVHCGVTWLFNGFYMSVDQTKSNSKEQKLK